MHISFLFKELITCGAVLSTFELVQALRKLDGVDADIVSEHENPDLQLYFDITPVKTPAKESITITCTPTIHEADYAYVRTFDDRWKHFKGQTIAVSPEISKWLTANMTIGNGVHERFYDRHIKRDIAILIEGNDEPNKNIDETVRIAKGIQEEKGLNKKIVWFGRKTRKIPGVINIDSPSITEIPELYNRARVFIKMSIQEGWCRPVQEASACGCVLIAKEEWLRPIVSWDSIAKKLNDYLQA